VYWTNLSYVVPQGKFITKSLCIGLISCQSYVVAQGKFIKKSLALSFENKSRQQLHHQCGSLKL
jgi:hypothetical protein